MEGLAALIALGLWIWSLVWVYQDAQARKNMGCLICLLIAFTWPIGLLLWVILRPEPDYYEPNDRYYRQ